MGALALSKLHVLITGAGASISRDAARLLASHGASVMAADPDARVLARLARDVSLYGAQIETAILNLGSASAIRIADDHLRLTGRSPHVVICCCGHHGADCCGSVAAQVLQPSLFLQLAPRPRGRLARAIEGLKHPTLVQLLARKPGRGVFDPNTTIPFVRIASHLYALNKGFEAAPQKAASQTEAASAAPTSRRRTPSAVSSTSPRADAA
jgi:hypothetical protein